MASTEPARAFQADPYDYGEVRRLATGLELAEPVAVTLVRRGYRTVEAAKRFLEAGEVHDPREFTGIEDVCERIVIIDHGRIVAAGSLASLLQQVAGPSRLVEVRLRGVHRRRWPGWH